MAFLVLVIYMIFFLLRPHQWGGADLANTLPLTVASLLMCLMIFTFSSDRKLFCTQFFLLCLFCGVVLISGFLNGWYMQGINSLKVFIPGAVIPLFLITNLVSTSKKQEVVMLLCLVSSMIMLTNGFSQKASPVGLGWAGSTISEGTRITWIGILRDPNDLGGFFVLSLPMAIYFFKHGASAFSRLFGTISAIFLLYGIYLTESRGALVATLTMTAAYFVYRYGKAKAVVMGFASLPVLVVILSNYRAIDAEESSAAGRTEAWYAGFLMLKNSPLFGVGMGNFVEHHFRTAHNSFVLVMGELGILGYGLWFCTVVLSFYMPFYMLMKYRNFWFEKTPIEDATVLREYRLNTTLFFSMLGYLCTAFFLTRSYAPVTYFLCGFAIAGYYRMVHLNPELAFANITKETWKVFGLSLLSIIGMNIIIKLVL